MLAILSCKCPDHSKGSSAERAGTKKKKERLIGSVMNERMNVDIKRAIKFFFFLFDRKVWTLSPTSGRSRARRQGAGTFGGTLGDSAASGPPETYRCGDAPVYKHRGEPSCASAAEAAAN